MPADNVTGTQGADNKTRAKDCDFLHHIFLTWFDYLISVYAVREGSSSFLSVSVQLYPLEEAFLPERRAWSSRAAFFQSLPTEPFSVKRQQAWEMEA